MHRPCLNRLHVVALQHSYNRFAIDQITRPQAVAYCNEHTAILPIGASLVGYERKERGQKCLRQILMSL